MEACEFNLAVAELEKFTVEVLSRQYVPMVRRDLWSDAPQTLNRRLTIYATLWHTLKTIVLLLNPIAPFLCEFLHQNAHRALDNSMPESISFEDWPEIDETLRNAELEKAFDNMLKAVALSFSARQSAQLKRRWPLQKAFLVTAPEDQLALENLHDVFLELANVKSVEFHSEESYLASLLSSNKNLAHISEGDLHVVLSTYRDEGLLGEGLMRDIARRIQAHRKEMGFSPTDVLEAVHLTELDSESLKLLKPYLDQLTELVRTKKVLIHKDRSEFDAVWHEHDFDDKRFCVAIEH
jgi:isoleucyl-tRNA synthetase